MLFKGKYRVKITNPWWDSRKVWYVVEVSTTWIPWYRVVKRVYYHYAINIAPKREEVFFSSYSQAKNFIEEVIQSIERYREYVSKVSNEYSNKVKAYRSTFNKATSSRII